MPKSKNTRMRGTKSAVLHKKLKGKRNAAHMPEAQVKAGFDPGDLKHSGKAQRCSGGKPPRFPGRAGGR